MFRPSFFMVYKYACMVALLVSNSMFLFRLQKKPRFVLRFALCVVGFIVLVSVFPPLQYNAVSSSIMFGCFFLFSVLMARVDLCQYFGQKKLKYYADFFSSSSSLCCGVI